MKIVFFVQHLGTGGVVRQIATQAEPLERRGHTVSLLGLCEFDEGWKLLGTSPRDR